MARYICMPAGGDEVFFDTLEQAKEYAKANERYGTMVKAEGSDEILFAPNGTLACKILHLAKEVTDYVRDNEFSYGNAPINPAINHDAKIVSCDRFVGWVLYKLGYVDQPYIQGLCVSGPGLTNWCIDHGFTRINSVAQLLPGDIVFTRKNSIDCPGHTFIYAGVSVTEGEHYRYDCGRVERIRSTQPWSEPISEQEGFLYGYRIRPVGDYITPSLSFKYDGVEFSELDKKVEILENGTRYTLPDGVVLTCELKKYPAQRVYWWVNRWENTTGHDSGLITDLWDCDIAVPFEPDVRPSRRDRQDTWEPKSLRVYEGKGANVSQDDYSPSYTRIWEGDTYTASCDAGRSGLKTSPFLDINRNEYGVIIAIGWTGQWQAHVDRTAEGVRIRSGIQFAQQGFKIRSGEKFRTSSAAVMMYYRGQNEAHNRFRSFMREISPVGENSPRGKQTPFSAIFWGGVSTKQMFDRWGKIFENKLPFDTCWIDAGWYEPLRSTTTAGQSADWPQIGRWEVNRFYHPNGYVDLVEYLKEHGVGFMLWFEPERINKRVGEPWIEYLPPIDPNTESVLAALNKDEVCDAIIEMVSEKVRELSLSVYRQDINILPLSIWVKADEEDRHGMTEILYINNLYRFWDALLERFPNLLIDNCAGGGHRNDVEMLSRSVPMWRSDYQCRWDCLPEANQMQNQASWWMPYAGIGYGPTLGDLYSFRSAYCNGMTVRTWEHADPEWEVGAMNEPLDWARKYFAEYNEVRHFFAQDMYPLIPFSRENATWCATQYIDRSNHTGVILAFRRAECPYDEVTVKLEGLLLTKTYHFTNADTGEEFDMTGYELTTKGLRLKLDSPRSSLLLRFN